MKLLLISSLLVFGIFSSTGQTEQNAAVSADNPLYMEWVAEHGFRFISDFKDGEITLNASEVLDVDGNVIPENINETTFQITNYDFDQIVAPEKNTMIKITADKAVFIKSKHRQEVLFKRYLINLSANN